LDDRLEGKREAEKIDGSAALGGGLAIQALPSNQESTRYDALLRKTFMKTQQTFKNMIVMKFLRFFLLEKS
jgi:hypothetical protein